MTSVGLSSRGLSSASSARRKATKLPDQRMDLQKMVTLPKGSGATTINGRPVEVIATVTVHFALR